MKRSKPQNSPSPVLESGRINRYIARAGVCSRRNADTLIDDGLVQVNGKVVREYWFQVKKGDQVSVNGKNISPCLYKHLLLNKPKDTITTAHDDKGRKTVLDLIKIEGGINGLFPVGRLDRATSGVLLLTTDGDLGHRLMHPSFEIPKHYKIRTKSPIKSSQIDQLLRGIDLEDGLAKCDQVIYVKSGDLREIGIELHAGRNRQIRRMLEALGHEIIALERTSYAGLTTRGLRRGAWRELTQKETRTLYRMVQMHNRT
ncbi:MAG: pseudouridine synthase [Bacteroidetes bacterium]|nr:pseudouridine synthase [Bacteroidota bacterium]